MSDVPPDELLSFRRTEPASALFADRSYWIALKNQDFAHETEYLNYFAVGL
jgi:hypothetical protein